MYFVALYLVAVLSDKKKIARYAPSNKYGRQYPRSTNSEVTATSGTRCLVLRVLDVW